MPLLAIGCQKHGENVSDSNQCSEYIFTEVIDPLTLNTF